MYKEFMNDEDYLTIDQLEEAIFEYKCEKETEEQQVNQTTEELVDAIMDMVEADIEEGVAETTITHVEECALEVMTFIGQSNAFLQHIMKCKPEKVYVEAEKLANMLAARFNNKFSKEETEKALNYFKEINTIEDTKMLDKVKALFSIFLVNAGKILLGVVGFSLDTLCVGGIYLVRVATHVGRETRWAANEIGSSFKKRILNK